jgi:hypothetical protein
MSWLSFLVNPHKWGSLVSLQHEVHARKKQKTKE